MNHLKHDENSGGAAQKKIGPVNKELICAATFWCILKSVAGYSQKTTYEADVMAPYEVCL